MRKKTLKWILILTLSITALYIAYELELKFVINEYQISRIEDKLQDNFFDHSEELTELSKYLQKFGDFDLMIRPSNELHLTISDTAQQPGDQAYFLITNDTVRFLDLSFEPNNMDQVILKSTLFDTVEVVKWRIEYQGMAKSEIASTMLNSRGIHDNDLIDIISKLKSVNSIGISKNEQWVKIIYKGFNWDSFNYIYPLNVSEPEPEWNYLTDNFYWEHYEFELYCEWTNWGWL